MFDLLIKTEESRPTSPTSPGSAPRTGWPGGRTSRRTRVPRSPACNGEPKWRPVFGRMISFIPKHTLNHRWCVVSQTQIQDKGSSYVGQFCRLELI